MTPSAILEAPAASATPTAPSAPRAPMPGYRLRPIMRQGTASGIPETWVRFPSLEAACGATKAMYHDDRVLRVFVVTDEAPPHFVQWVER